MCRGFPASDFVAELSIVDAMEKHQLLLLPVQYSIDKPAALNQNEQAKQSLEPDRFLQCFGKRFELEASSIPHFKRLEFETLHLDRFAKLGQRILQVLFINTRHSCTVEPCIIIMKKKSFCNHYAKFAIQREIMFHR